MAFAPQKVQIRRTETPDNPPVNPLPGELVVEMANPLRLWVGVPASIDPSLRRLLVPHSSVISSDTPPPAPIPNQLWWESDTGILWLNYYDGNSSQWVQVSSGGQDIPDVPTEADEIVVVPGGNLAANDVQEALIELDAEKVAKNGDTMIGQLKLIAPVAPEDAANKAYVDTKIGDAPNDGQTYGRQNAAWVSLGDLEVHAEAVHFLPTGTISSSNVQSAIVEVNNEKIGDAPTGGAIYGRQDNAWVVVVPVGGGPATNATAVSFTPTGGIAATNVQAGMVELDNEKLAKTGGTLTGALTLPAGAPAGANDAANKTYVDTKAATTYVDNADNLRVLKAGDTMTGHLSLPINPGAAQAVRRDYVDQAAQLRVAKTGDSMTGALQIVGNAGALITGNITTYGWSGNNNLGIVFLNSAQNRYLHYDGTSYVLAGAQAYSAAGRLWGTNDFNYTPANAAGQAFGGAISAPTFTGNVVAPNVTVTGGAIWCYGFQGNNATGVIYLGNSGTHYIHNDGSNINLVTPGTLNVSGNITSTGNITANAAFRGPGSNGGAYVQAASGNRISFFYASPTLYFYVDDNQVKTFVIDHPLDPQRYLAHGCLEGPEAGVYYRGKGVLKGTSVTVELPSYFTALVDEESATVQITPIMTKRGAVPLGVSEVKDGRFEVCVLDFIPVDGQHFHWRVEATRKDIAPLDVEPLKDEIEVHGDGPYTYYSRKP